MELGNVFVNGFLLADAKQVFLELFFLVRVFKDFFDSYDKSCDDVEDNATLFNYNSEASFSHMLVKKVIAKGWFDLVCCSVAEE